jgi:hypothetical protein
VFQTGSVQRNAFQLGGVSRLSAAFQQGAFQGGAFQVYSGSVTPPDGPSAAFQQGAFQGGAFQLYSGYQDTGPETPETATRSGRWHPDDAKRPRRPVKPIIYVDEDGNPVELGKKPAPAAPEPVELTPAAREDIPLDLLASQLAEETQALAAAAMARIEDEFARFLIIQQMDALAAEEARNAAIIMQIIFDVVSRETDDVEAMMLLAASV